jgi:nitrogen fixation/metabolism regulation signal transduction histidine kinase
MMAPRENRNVTDGGGHSSFRRRKYLVDSRMQLASTIKVAGIVLILLIILNSALAYQNLSETRRIVAANPHLAEQMQANEVRNMAILAAISLIILAMVVLRSIMITHRTAGAMHKIIDHLDEVAAGHYNLTLRLRREDTLRPLEDAFNRMANALRRRAQDDHKSLAKLADEISGHGNPVDAEMVRRIADARGRLAD